MPCGGIYPGMFGGVSNEGLLCFQCDKPDCELWCEEWDAPLHRKCVREFLRTPEGLIIVEHKHEIILEEDGPDMREALVHEMEHDEHPLIKFPLDTPDILDTLDPDVPIPYRLT